MGSLKEAWHNTLYKATICYLITLVTLIFGLQLYQFFHGGAYDKTHCGFNRPSTSSLLPVIGVLLDAKP